MHAFPLLMPCAPHFLSLRAHTNNEAIPLKPTLSIFCAIWRAPCKMEQRTRRRAQKRTQGTCSYDITCCRQPQEDERKHEQQTAPGNASRVFRGLMLRSIIKNKVPFLINNADQAQTYTCNMMTQASLPRQDVRLPHFRSCGPRQ